MSDKQTFDEKHIQHPHYQIRIKGHLDARWAEWFEGLTIMQEADDVTLLTGPVADQAALYGLLKKVRDLGMPLISVSAVERSPSTKLGAGQADQPNSFKKGEK
jgi:hypothetical protein